MSTTPDPLQVGITTDVGAIAQALAAVFRMGDDIFNVLNSPALLAARKSQDVQDALVQMDADLKAAQGGDKDALTKVDREASG